MQMSLPTRRNYMGRRWIPVVVERVQVRDESHRKDLVDLGGVKDGAPICGGVMRVACHITPPSNLLSRSLYIK